MLAPSSPPTHAIDTAGFSLNTLITVMSLIDSMFAPLFAMLSLLA